MLYIDTHTPCVAHTINPAAMQALDILERDHRRQVIRLTHEYPIVDPTSVVFVTTSLVTYPSRFFRLLPKDASEAHHQRLHRERRELVGFMPWLAPAHVVAINPRRLHGDRIPASELTGFSSALGSLCGYKKPREQEVQLTPAAKKLANMNLARQRRKDYYMA